MSDPNVDLRARFGTARRPQRAVARPRPPGSNDATVQALGKLSEALEVVEHARGALYEFHRLSGQADLTLQQALELLRGVADDGSGERAGLAGLAQLAELADEIDDVLVGRDVVSKRWTFELIDDYDANYWSVFRAVEAKARWVAGRADKHVFEAEMKAAEQRRGSES